MGRKTKDTVEYFPFVIKDGKTLFVLQRKYGLAGIGFFTQTMRMLGQTPGHYYTYVDEYDKDRFNVFCGLSESDVRAMLTDMAKTGKIDRELWDRRSVIYSQAFVDELEDLYRKRKTDAPTREMVIEETEVLEGVKTPADSGGFPESADICGFSQESGNESSESADFRQHSIGEDSRGEDSNMSADALAGDGAVDGAQPEGPPGPKPMPALRDPIARLWEDVLTGHQPPDTWDSIPKQRKKITELAKKSANLMAQAPFETPAALIGAVLDEYQRLKSEAKPSDSYWRNASYQPSDILQRWPQIWQSLSQRHQRHADQAEYARELEEIPW